MNPNVVAVLPGWPVRLWLARHGQSAANVAGSDARVLIVAHQVVVLCFRYLLERMTEAQILRPVRRP